MITIVVGVAATVAGLARSWPQVARIVVRRDAEGVSAMTWMLSLSAFITWEAIGILERIPLTIVFNILSFLGASAVLVTLVWQRHLGVWLPGIAAVLAVAVNVSVFLIFGAVGTSVLGIGISALMFLPQAAGVALRPSLGVSSITWWLAVTTSVLWMLYGRMVGQFVLVVPNLFMLPAEAIILWRLSTTRVASAAPAAV
jgi:uncharacterized protein with PQ loop repeat